jgi:hypothetical protein
VKKPPYPRPQKLSDPYGDWFLGTAEKLLAVPDDKLEWHHYQGYLGPHLPAGTYEESVYFLPGAFKMFKEQEHSLDLASPVIGFISKNASQLEADGLLESCRTEVTECLDEWTRNFIVIHFDKDACLEKGWNKRPYFDYVKGVETVCETLCELDRFEMHGDLADVFITNLAQPTVEPEKSAWFLELVRAQDDVRSPPNRQSFLNLFADQDILLEKQLAVEKYVLDKTPSPTYWRDAFKKIGLS